MPSKTRRMGLWCEIGFLSTARSHVKPRSLRVLQPVCLLGTNWDAVVGDVDKDEIDKAGYSIGWGLVSECSSTSGQDFTSTL